MAERKVRVNALAASKLEEAGKLVLSLQSVLSEAVTATRYSDASREEEQVATILREYVNQLTTASLALLMCRLAVMPTKDESPTTTTDRNETLN